MHSSYGNTLSYTPYQYGQGLLPKGNLSEEDLRQAFYRVDRDRNGFISYEELRVALGDDIINQETCRLLLSLYDTNKDGQISFEEFKSLWGYVQKWRECFQNFDKDRNGVIDASELHQALNQFGYRLSYPFCQSLVSKFRSHMPHVMNFGSFIQCCVMLKGFTSGFAAKDVQRRGIATLTYEDFLSIVFMHGTT
ncbi:peflin-like [Zophobas morio]|uniref:peflin-like n=1 Tax=Zophobas morio TaxID=2755281 RepID=UPI003082E16B